jgi:intracellular sulfur oxidation DsrE/DsrF family protein
MNRRSALGLFGLTFALPVFAQQKKPAAKQRVLFQVSDADPQKWNLALNNAKNVQAELGKENVQIEIVAYGPGLEMLKAESKVSDRLAGALDDSVGLIACEERHVQRHRLCEGRRDAHHEAPKGRLGLYKALAFVAEERRATRRTMALGGWLGQRDG